MWRERGDVNCYGMKKREVRGGGVIIKLIPREKKWDIPLTGWVESFKKVIWDPIPHLTNSLPFLPPPLLNASNSKHCARDLDREPGGWGGAMLIRSLWAKKEIFYYTYINPRCAMKTGLPALGIRLGRLCTYRFKKPAEVVLKPVFFFFFFQIL